MLRFFRINDPYRLVFIFLLLLLIRFGQSFFIHEISYFELKWLLLGEWLSKGFSMYREAFDYTGPLAALIYKYLDILFGRSTFMHHSLNAILIIVQAGIFNQLLLRNKAFDENSYLPAFLYMILMVAVPDFMSLSPQLMSLTFILLAFRNVLRRIDNQVTDELFLNTGLFIGVATMIYLPTIVYFLVFLVALILFSTAVTRRLILYFFGFSLVFAMCTLYFFWHESIQEFWESFFIEGLTLKAMPLISLYQLMLLSIPLIIVLLFGVAKTWSSSRLTNFQQKVQQVIWLMFFGAIATFLLSNEKSGHELIFTIPVIAYFWTHYFILLKRKIFKALMPGILVFGVLAYSIYSYKELTNDLIVPEDIRIDNSTMILGDGLVSYWDFEMGTPCFHPKLCQEAFNELNYYESAAQLYELMIKAEPNTIVDEFGVMTEMFNRFPLLASSYSKTNKNTYTKISN